MTESIIQFLGVYVALPILALQAIIKALVWLSPDGTKKAVARVINSMTYVRLNLFARKGVKLDLEGSINSASKGIFGNSRGMEPRELKVRWVGKKDVSPESVLGAGKVIVRIKPHKERYDNFVAACLAYAPEVTLPRFRRLVHKGVMVSADCVVAKKLLKKTCGGERIELFYDQISHMLQQNKSEKIYVEMERVDDKGKFLRVLIPELHNTCIATTRRGYPHKNIALDSLKLLAFLHAIATKEKETDVPLVFLGTDVKIQVVLIKDKPLKNYQEAIMHAFKEGSDAVYVAAEGQHVKKARALLSTQRHNDRLEKSFWDTFYFKDESGRKVPAICAGMRLKS